MNPISIAPMIGWTDRHYRYMFRHITRRATLYTEMVMDTTIVHNPNKLEHFIGYDRDLEPPLVIQLGGYKPETLAKAVEYCESYGGFDEINLNCGCPSNKAKRCGFGAELMLEPELVRQIVSEMKRRTTSAEVTVKCRIGLNVRDTWGDLVKFVLASKEGGVNKMIIHARICVLNGLSPAQNRNVPPLRYDIVSRLVEAFPDMKFVLNGGVRFYEEADNLLGFNATTREYKTGSLPTDCVATAVRTWEDVERAWDLTEKLSLPYQHASAQSGDDLPECEEDGHSTCGFEETEEIDNEEEEDETFKSSTSADAAGSGGDHHAVMWDLSSPVHGVMIGREAYNNPWAWANLDHHYHNVSNPGFSRREVLERYLTYAEAYLQSEGPRATIPYLCKPLHNYFTGSAANKHYKRKLDALLKEHITHQNASRRRHLTNVTATFSDIIREAVQDTIPDWFLDQCMGPEGRMIVAET
eukprot:gene10361-12115_t